MVWITPYCFHSQHFQKCKNIQKFKYRFSLITGLILYLLINNNTTVAFSDNIKQSTIKCKDYLKNSEFINDIHWSGLIEFGVSRKQMWGFDVSVVFLFDDKTLQNFGRPIINFELQKSYSQIMEDILDGKKIRLKVGGEMYSFNYKFKAPSDLISKFSSMIQNKKKGQYSNYCGISTTTISSIEKYDQPNIEEEKLDPKIWPWIAYLYLNNTYLCNVNMITRSEGLIATKFLNTDILETHIHYLRLITFNEETDHISHPSFVPACLSSEIEIEDNGSIIGYEQKFHKDLITLNRINITIFSLDHCSGMKNFSYLHQYNTNFCGINQNGLTWLSLDGLDGAGFYVLTANQWFLKGIVDDCLRSNDTNDCDFDSPVIIFDFKESTDWILNWTLYYPLGLESGGNLDEPNNENNLDILAIFVVVIMTFICLVGMWGLWYTCRKRNRLLSEVPTLINSNDGIQLLKRENKRFSYLN
uniref:CSON011286 protein n=1 Tax=Culicoides sonorensis TaxID=179676 RepID=A0A336LMK8_CULSO